ncbi:MAG: ROK family protein [Kiritimatiellales bacterium]|nr:ROK family protein [Kiritimatiellales bacterium]
MQRVQDKKADQVTVRRLNMSAILKLLRKRGTLARADLAKELGMTRNTASNIVTDLLQTNLVVETEYRREGAGRPGLLLELSPKAGFAVGAEIDISRITVVAVDFLGKILWEETAPVKDTLSQQDVVGLSEQMVKEALDWGLAEQLKPLGIGLGLAGLVDAEAGVLKYAPTLHWEEIPFKKLWEEKFDLPIYLDNEANAAAVGYFSYADHYTSRNLAYLSIGGGMAAGLLLDQHIFRGSKGFAGQAGHMKIRPGGELCSCGGHGCWVTEVGIPALYRQLKVLILESDEPARERYRALIDSSTYKIDLDAAAGLLRKNDAKLQEIVDAMALMLGLGIANLINLFNLDKVILGGAMRPILPFMADKVRITAEELTLPQPFASASIKVSGRDDDGVFGAASMVLDAIHNDPIPLVRALI